jgi:hypothetical protein
MAVVGIFTSYVWTPAFSFHAGYSNNVEAETRLSLDGYPRLLWRLMRHTAQYAYQEVFNLLIVLFFLGPLGDPTPCPKFESRLPLVVSISGTAKRDEIFLTLHSQDFYTFCERSIISH